MRDVQLEHHFKTARQLTGIDAQVENFVKDLTVSTSLAVYEGPYIRFCHRSFHEYFAAVFLCNLDDSAVEALSVCPRTC
jgi:hypothetical protein